MARGLVSEVRRNRRMLSSGVAVGVSSLMKDSSVNFIDLSCIISFPPWFDRLTGRVRKSHLLVLSGARWEVSVYSYLTPLLPSISLQLVQGQYGVLRLHVEAMWGQVLVPDMENG